MTLKLAMWTFLLATTTVSLAIGFCLVRYKPPVVTAGSADPSSEAVIRVIAGQPFKPPPEIIWIASQRILCVRLADGHWLHVYPSTGMAGQWTDCP